jgi:aminoglycoside phosphotransferase (APT) family kinase protein
MDETAAADPRSAVLGLLARTGLVSAGDHPALTPLAGGVSSDIWRVDLPGRSLCIKRALPRLKVAQLWEAPVERNHNEANWMRFVAGVLPQAVPRLIAEDREAGAVVMEFLDPAHCPLWKSELLAGRVDRAFAGRVGAALARIHAASAGRADIAAQFASDAIFHAIRLEPYLGAAARVHAGVAEKLEALIARTAETKRALVHGDVSPKNILIGARGPVFLDAECAWYGDPAFDLAFCLNHMLLKCLAIPRCARDLLACFDAMARAYGEGVGWEEPPALEARAARLLPALFLARVDGKSPVEYVTEHGQKERVRRTALPLIAEPPARLSVIRNAWAREVAA